jgi:hypothetical protein
MDQNILLKSNKNTDELVLNGRVYQMYDRKNVKGADAYYRCKYMRKKDYLCKVYLKITNGVCDTIDDNKHTCPKLTNEAIKSLQSIQTIKETIKSVSEKASQPRLINKSPAVHQIQIVNMSRIKLLIYFNKQIFINKILFNQ